MNDGGSFFIPGPHDVLALLVSTVGRKHGIDHRKLVSHLGEFLEVHPHLHVVDVGVDYLGIAHDITSLRIEGVEVSHSTRKVDVDEILRLGAFLGGDTSRKEGHTETDSQREFSRHFHEIAATERIFSSEFCDMVHENKE